jgi:nucleotide-binding universal stress UspA family protein
MNILICVSSMPHARSTVALGNLMASLLDKTISLLKVITAEEEAETAASTLDVVQKLIEKPVAETAVTLGTPAKEILRKAQSGSYSLIVVGAHAIRNLWDQFLQSVTHKVANQASVSVLVARGDATQLRHLLICTSGHVNSEMVIRNGATLAKAAQARVTLLHVAESMPAMYAGLGEMEETLPELLQTDTPLARHLKWASEYLVQAQVLAELKLRRGITLDEIVDEALEGTYDLIVVGARADYDVLSSLLMGQVTPKIIDNTPCSVLIIRGDL